MFSMILVIFNFLIFFVMFLAIYYDSDWPNTINEIYGNFGFAPNYLIGKDAGLGFTIFNYNTFKPFTIFTHMFIHSYFSFFHILMNMVFLLFLGMPFEEKVGPWVFMVIYFIAGIFASLFTAIFAFLSGGLLGQDPMGISIGASGAIFGIMGAFVATYPGEKIMFPLIIIRKWPVWLIAAIYFGIETIIAASNPNDSIGHYAHIGGFVGGLFFAPLINKLKISQDTAASLKALDLEQLEKFATNYKLKNMLDRIKNEDQKDVRDAWLEEFMKKIICPECGKKLVVTPGRAKCETKGCGFKIKY